MNLHAPSQQPQNDTPPLGDAPLDDDTDLPEFAPEVASEDWMPPPSEDYQREHPNWDKANNDNPHVIPTIRITAGLRHENADAGLAAMKAAGIPFYVRNRALVRTCIIQAKTSSGELVKVPSIIPVNRAMIGRAMGQTAIWERVNQDGAIRRLDPPQELTEQVMGMAGEWPFPPLNGVISTPTLRPDGSLLCREGYDEVTGLVLMAPPVMPPIPERPTKADAQAALKLLLDLLIEFPFADDISRSVGLSLLMTPVLRGGLLPAVPMHIATAPESGTGKSYLADVASAIATGDRCYVQSVAPGDPKETEKRLIAAVLAGYPIVAFDNANGGEGLFGDFLCRLTERPGLQPRPLGGSEQPRIANTFTVIANGNSVTLHADMVRRSLIALLDANMEDPENRVFKAKPVATVLANRGLYVAACIIIARAYIVEGRPRCLSPTPSYEGWSDTVRSALVWLGRADPIASQAALRVEDPVRQATAAVFSAWASECGIDARGVLVTELITAADARTTEGPENAPIEALQRPLLREALLNVAPSPGGEARINSKKLGWWLRRASNKVSGGMKLTADRTNPTRPRWILSVVARSG